MKLNTYLNYGGNGAEAFQFYEKKPGGKILMMMKHGDMPDSGQSLPEAFRNQRYCALHRSRAAIIDPRAFSNYVSAYRQAPRITPITTNDAPK